MTYGDKIRSMNDKELAEFLSACVISDMTVTEFIEDELSTVTPTRKGGKWISNVYQNRSCSICNYFISEDDVSEFNYCPNCGAYMRGNENG